MLELVTSNLSSGSFNGCTDVAEPPAIENWIQRRVQEYKSLGEFCSQDREVSGFVTVSENKEDKIWNIAECVNQANVEHI